MFHVPVESQSMDVYGDFHSHRCIEESDSEMAPMTLQI